MAPNAFELPFAQQFLLHKCVAQQILFHDYQLLCMHEAVWDKGAEELLAPSHGVSLLGRDRIRQCAREPVLQSTCSMCNRARQGKAWVCKGRLESRAYVSLALSWQCAPSFAFCCALCCSPCCALRQSASSTLGEPRPGPYLPLAPSTTTTCTLTLSH